MSNVEQLNQAGVIPNPSALTPEDVNLINSLTAAEVSALISAKNKLGPACLSRNMDPNANCFI